MTTTFLAGDARQTLDHFRRSVDQLFENFYGLPAETGRSLQGSSQWTFSPVLETAWGDSSLNLRAILPGVAQQDLKVSVQNNQLILEGERKAPETFKNNARKALHIATALHRARRGGERLAAHVGVRRSLVHRLSLLQIRERKFHHVSAIS